MNTTELGNLADQLPIAPDRRIILGNHDFLFFGGTAYLSLNKHPNFIRLFVEGLQRYGLNNGTSRTNNIQLDVYNRAENDLAKHFGFEDATLLSSGFLAAQLTARTMAGTLRDDKNMIYAPGSHPALWINGKPKLTETDFGNWINNTIEHINTVSGQRFVVISNTVDNVLPKVFDFSAFEQIHPGNEIHFILDDSHGLGVLNQDECPVAKTIPMRDDFKTTVVASLAKGMGIDAGVIFADKATTTSLKKTGMFVGASPPSPAFLHAWLQRKDLYSKQYQALQQNIQYFRSALKSDWQSVKNFPVFHKAGIPIYESLMQENIMISSFSYPDPDDQAIDRIVISAAHTQADLDVLIRALDKIGAL